jgi:hypothetical protein
MGESSTDPKKKKITRRQRLHRLTMFLQLSLGLYLFVFGITTLSSSDTLTAAVVGIFRILSSAALLSALSALEKTKVLSRVLIMSVVFWLSAAVFSELIIPLVSGEFVWYQWLERVLMDMAVCAALLIIRLERK